MARAGNIGTNHLFEAMVLDRLMALSLGWLALAAVVEPARAGVVASGNRSCSGRGRPSLAGVAACSYGNGIVDGLGPARWPGLGSLDTRPAWGHRGGPIGVTGPGAEPWPGRIAASGIAAGRFLDVGHRASESSAHVAAPLAHAAVAGLGRLPCAGGSGDSGGGPRPAFAWWQCSPSPWLGWARRGLQLNGCTSRGSRSSSRSGWPQLRAAWHSCWLRAGWWSSGIAASGSLASGRS